MLRTKLNITEEGAERLFKNFADVRISPMNRQIHKAVVSYFKGLQPSSTRFEYATINGKLVNSSQ